MNQLVYQRQLNAEMEKMMADPEFANSEMGRTLQELMAAGGGLGQEL